ncbi:zinc-binding dehydrogenase [bacterium]|nr:zinc-binding dehydrogenase [bacterium]
MRAAVYRGQPHLEVEDWPDPIPGPGEVTIKVAGCGLCHTDLHYLDHGVPTFKKPPLILGHEISGTVDALGEGVAGWSLGDRVLLPAVTSCGSCPWCREGRANICQDMRMFGNDVDGGYAEMVVAPARELFALPAEIPLVQGCVIADAVSTPWHAIQNRARVRPGEEVAVFGVGGVGINVVQCAVLAGGRVTAVDIDEGKLALAKELGASATVLATPGESAHKAVKEATGGGAHVAVEAIGNPATILAALSSLRRGGRMVVLGYTDKRVELPVGKIMYHELSVVGTLGCGGGDYPAIIAMVAGGRLDIQKVVTGTLALDDINVGLDRLRRGEGLRWVVTP